jgi:CheY-like chemotaxis protein
MAFFYPDQSAPTSIDPPYVPLPLNAWKVVIVDDTEDDQIYLAHVLRYYGIEVYVVAGGADCLTLLQTLHPTLILSDLMMPGMDGWELLNHIRLNPATLDIPVVALTADDSTVMSDRAYRHGFNAYIGKPVRHRDLVERLKALLAA